MLITSVWICGIRYESLGRGVDGSTLARDLIIRDFRLSPPHKWDLRSSGILRCVKSQKSAFFRFDYVFDGHVWTLVISGFSCERLRGKAAVILTNYGVIAGIITYTPAVTRLLALFIDTL